ncbi:MAG: class I SAM-dependent methyltransferase, partial [Firmicutes bacterium]|nr:class I SAM-dependent methyltransferase [Bacillota bacterium]
AAHEKTSHVTAIDINERRIEIAKSDLRAAGIDFRVMDVTKTPFSDSQFDVALIVLGLHEMAIEEARKALVETRRIAKKLVVVEFGLDRWPLFWSFFRYVLAIFEPPSFLKFTRYNVANLIEDAGWKIERKEADFPFETYICV